MLADMRLCAVMMAGMVAMTPVAGRAATPVASALPGPDAAVEATPAMIGDSAEATAVSPEVPAPVVVAPPVTPPVATPVAPQVGVEGAAPAPEHPWVVRNRQLGVPAGMLLAMSSAALIAVAATGGIYGSDRNADIYDGGYTLRAEHRQLIISGAAFGVAFTGLAIVGGMWLKHRRSRPGGLVVPEREKVYWRHVRPGVATGREDPRLDPVWARHDRNLTRGMIGTGIALGVALASLGVTLGVLFAPCGSCDDNTGEVVGSISLGAIAGIVAIPFTGLTIARGVHRRPLRRWRASLAGGGLQIAF